VRIFRILLAAALGAAAHAHAELARPPVGTGTNVPVWRGESVPVTLRGFFRNNPVEYTIDRPPRHGTLSPVRQPDPDRVAVSTDGSVVYTHDDSEGNTSDEFTFRVRGLRGGLSAPATVRITITDRPPVLTAPTVLEFTAAAGESMTRLLGLTNTGGGVLQGEVRLSPPFATTGDNSFSLARGQSTNIAIRYAPMTAGDESGENIRPGRNDSAGAQIMLRGSSTAPFEAETADPEFLVDGATRKTQLTLHSLADGPQTVALATEPSGLVDLPASVQLAPGATLKIPLLIPPERKGERREVGVRIATPHHRQQLLLVAPPVPAEMHLGPGTLDFTARQPATVTVANTGGVPGRFHFDPVPGLVMDNGRPLDAREFVVPPDGETTVELRLDLPGESVAPDRVVVHLSGRKPASLAILAPEPLPPRPRPETAPGNSTIISKTSPPPRPWEPDRDIRVAPATRSLEWRREKNGWSTPRLELVRDDGATPYRTADPPRDWMTRVGDRISGFLGRLAPTTPDPAGWDTGAEAPLTEWVTMKIDEASAAGDSRAWVLTAEPATPGPRREVSDRFLVDWEAGTIEKIRLPPTPETTAPPTPVPDEAENQAATETQATMRSLTPALKVERARAAPTRRSARIEVIFPRDAEADSYRLEHGSNLFLTDEKTGLPYAGDFLPQPHPQATARVVGTSTMEHEGRELTVLLADIDGLDPGSASLWRVVTMTGGQDRWPTGEFQVLTLPPWRFPWHGALLSAAMVALGGLLYLRWRLNRPPG